MEAINTEKIIRIFISSPGDVGPEREIAAEVTRRLNERFQGRAEIDAYFWEHEPHLSGKDFTTSIGSTADYDVVVVILWKRLGSRLHGGHRKADGSPWESGTEYEVLSALEAREVEPVGLPELAVFVNVTPLVITAGTPTVKEELSQYEKLQDFIARTFNRTEDDGTVVNEQAYTTYAKLDEFEKKLTEILEKIVSTRVGSDGATDRHRPRQRVWQDNPYRGLDVFDFGHKEIFFGRTRAIGDALTLSRTALEKGCGYLRVIGSSGAGKSSLIRAGVIPRLIRPGVIEGIGLWRYALLKPSEGGKNPFRALASALLRDFSTEDPPEQPAALPELRDLEAGDATDLTGLLAAELARKPDAVAERIKDKLGQVASEARIHAEIHLKERLREMQEAGRLEDVAEIERAIASLHPPKARLVLVVDQLEELFTGDASKELVKDFVRALDALARSGRCLVISTLRADFRSVFMEAEGFADLSRDGETLELSAPSRVELGQIIREPAALAGHVFEKHPELGPLDERILNAALSDPDALPLLEYCLSELYKIGGTNGVLTHDNYEAIEELEGALAKRAEDTWQDLKEYQDVLERVLEKLVSLGEGEGQRETPVRRTALLKEVIIGEDGTEDAAAKALVDAFTAPEARLFVVGKKEGGEATLSVSHEKLLTHWPRAVAWKDSNREFLKLRGRIEASEAEWSRHGEHKDYLLPEGLPLAKASQLLEERSVGLKEGTRDYVRRSKGEAEWRQKRVVKMRRGVMAGLGVLTLVSVAAAGWARMKQGEAETERQRTRVQLERSQLGEGQAWVERAITAKEAGEPMTALGLISRSYGLQNQQTAMPKIATPGSSPLLALPITHDPNLERVRKKLYDGGLSLMNTIQPTMLPLWSTPSILHHPNVIIDLAYSRDGTLLCSASQDGIVRVWDAKEGGLKYEIQAGHDFPSIEFFPDGKRLATGSEDDPVVRIWDADSGKSIGILEGAQRNIVELAIDPQGKWLVAASSEAKLYWWNLRKPGLPPIVTHAHNSRVNCLAFSSDGTFLASSSGGEPVVIWNTVDQSKDRSLEIPGKSVTCLVFPADGNLLISGSSDGIVRFTNTETDKEAFPDVETGFAVASISSSPDGRTFVVCPPDVKLEELKPGYPFEYAIYNMGDLTKRSTRKIAYGVPSIAAFHPNGKLIAVSGNSSMIHVQSVQESDDKRQIDSIGEIPITVEVVPDGSVLVSGTTGGTLQTWDAFTGEPLDSHRVFESPYGRIRIHPHGTLVASSSSDASIHFNQLANGVISPWGGPIHLNSTVGDMRFAPDRNQLFVGLVNGALQIWDLATLKVVREVKAGESAITCMSVTTDGTQIATGLFDGSVRVWDTKSLEEYRPNKNAPSHGKPVLATQFTIDGTELISSSFNGDRWNWDVDTMKVFATIKGDSKLSTSSLAMSRDGKWYAAGRLDGGMELIRSGDGEPLHYLAAGHATVVTSISFTPDGNRLATASFDGTIRLWDVRVDSQDDQAMNSLVSDDGGSDAFLEFSPDGSVVARRVARSGVDGETGQFLDFSETASKRLLDSWELPVNFSVPAIRTPVQLAGEHIGYPRFDFSGSSLICLSRDWRNYAVAMTDGEVRIVDVHNGRQLRSVKPLTETIRSLCFNASGDSLIVGYLNGKIAILSVKGSERDRVETAHTGPVYAIDVSRDGQYIATTSLTDSAMVWNAKTMEPVSRINLPVGYILSVRFSPDGKCLALATSSSGLVNWNIKENRPIGSLDCEGDVVFDVDCHPDGNLFAAAAGSSVVFWDIARNSSWIGAEAQLNSSGGVINHIVKVRFSPDGQTVSYVSRDGVVRSISISQTPLGSPVRNVSPDLNLVTENNSLGEISGSRLKQWWDAGYLWTPPTSTPTFHWTVYQPAKPISRSLFDRRELPVLSTYTDTSARLADKSISESERCSFRMRYLLENGLYWQAQEYRRLLEKEGRGELLNDPSTRRYYFSLLFDGLSGSIGDGELTPETSRLADEISEMLIGEDFSSDSTRMQLLSMFDARNQVNKVVFDRLLLRQVEIAPESHAGILGNLIFDRLQDSESSEESRKFLAQLLDRLSQRFPESEDLERLKLLLVMAVPGIAADDWIESANRLVTDIGCELDIFSQIVDRTIELGLVNPAIDLLSVGGDIYHSESRWTEKVVRWLVILDEKEQALALAEKANDSGVWKAVSRELEGKEALECLVKSVDGGAAQISDLFDAAVFAISLEETKVAEDLFMRIVKHPDVSSDQIVEATWYFLQSGEADKVGGFYDLALERASDDESDDEGDEPEIVKARVNKWFGYFQVSLGNWPEALECFSRDDEDFVDEMHSLGRAIALLKVGEIEKAVNEYKRLVASGEFEGEAFDWMSLDSIKGITVFGGIGGLLEELWGAVPKSVGGPNSADRTTNPGQFIDPASLNDEIDEEPSASSSPKVSPISLRDRAISQWLMGEKEAAIESYRFLISGGNLLTPPMDWKDPKVIQRLNLAEGDSITLEAVRKAAVDGNPTPGNSDALRPPIIEAESDIPTPLNQESKNPDPQKSPTGIKDFPPIQLSRP